MIVGLQRESNDYKMQLAEAEHKVSQLKTQIRKQEDERDDQLDANTKMINTIEEMRLRIHQLENEVEKDSIDRIIREEARPLKSPFLI